METPDPILTPFRQNILLVLRAGPRNGLAVGRGLENHHGTIVRERLYRNLDALDELGLVEKEPVDGRENRYFLTADGQEWLRRQRA